MRFVHVLAVALAGTLVLVACSGQEPERDQARAVTLSTNGHGLIGPEGGTVISYDGMIELTVPAEALEEAVAFQIGTTGIDNAGDRLQQLDPIYGIHQEIILAGTDRPAEFGLPYSITLDVGVNQLEGKKVYVATWSPAENRWRELSADYAITTDYVTLVILMHELPVLTGEYADLDLANVSPDDVATAIDGFSVVVIFADLAEEALRCQAFEGEWMDVTLEWDHPNGYCAVQGDDYWDSLHPSAPRQTYVPGEPDEAGDLGVAAFNPSFRGTAFILTANVGHTWGNYNCCQDMYKLSNAGAEQRIHDNLNVLDPDIILFQELGNRFYWNTFASEVSSGNYIHHALSTSHRWPNNSSGLRVQVERLVKDAGPAYNYVCSRYLPGTFGDSEENAPHYVQGMAFTCVVWNTAKFKDPVQLPGALRGYTILDGGAGVQLRYVTATRPIRVVSVHALAGVGSGPIARRVANFHAYRNSTYVSSGAATTLWGGDFNLQPAQSGADGSLLRSFVHWGSLVPSDILSTNPNNDFLRPLRTTNQTTANVTLFYNRNLDHLFATRAMPGAVQCTVLYTNAHRLDYWNGSGGGMDHRAVACGTSFNYDY